MAEKQTTPKTTASPSTDGGATDAGDLGMAEVQQRFDKEQAQGFSGIEVDETPNENYSLQGGPAGEGTPEGDRQAGKEPRNGK